MNNFPLYRTLDSEVTSSKDLTVKQKEECVARLKTIDADGAELVYALIRRCNPGEVLPYGGQRWKKDIRFNFNDFPIRLKHIIHKFLNLHFAKLKEQHLRQNTINHVVETQ